MKNTIYLILFFLLPFFGLSQETITSEVVATYNLKYKMNKNSTYSTEEDFILFMAKDKSFYKSVNQYVLDSLKKNSNQDALSLEVSYYTNFYETILTFPKDKVITSYKIINNRFRTSEDSNLNWTIDNKNIYDIKGFKCKKAVLKKFGRIWVAYYSTENPLPFGPYKFNGLPGLIIRVYDVKQEFVYELNQLKKKRVIYQIPESKYKLIEKSKLLQNYPDMKCNPNNSGRIFENANERRDFENSCKERLNNLNRIELKPFE